MLHEHQLLLALPDEGGWPGEERGDEISAWRMRERMKTPSLMLVLALNIGVDPPDVTKPTPCARLECWLDPLAGPVAGQKAIEAIATALQQQYEQWQPRGAQGLSVGPTSWQRPERPCRQSMMSLMRRAGSHGQSHARVGRK